MSHLAKYFIGFDSDALSKCSTIRWSGSLWKVFEGELVILDGRKVKGLSPKSRGNKGLWILIAWVGCKLLAVLVAKERK